MSWVSSVSKRLLVDWSPGFWLTDYPVFFLIKRQTPQFGAPGCHLEAVIMEINPTSFWHLRLLFALGILSHGAIVGDLSLSFLQPFGSFWLWFQPKNMIIDISWYYHGGADTQTLSEYLYGLGRKYKKLLRTFHSDLVSLKKRNALCIPFKYFFSINRDKVICMNIFGPAI